MTQTGNQSLTCRFTTFDSLGYDRAQLTGRYVSQSVSIRAEQIECTATTAAATTTTTTTTTTTATTATTTTTTTTTKDSGHCHGALSGTKTRANTKSLASEWNSL